MAQINQTLPTIKVTLNDVSYYIDLYDNPIAYRWVEALKKVLKNNLVLEKNYCFLGFADSKRDIDYLVKEINDAVTKINAFTFNPPYPKLKHFTNEDFQYSVVLGFRLKHEGTNFLHRYFEELQGTVWNLSTWYKQADNETKYAIRQLNILCHELESWVSSYRKSKYEPEWMRPSQITTFLHAPRYDLHEKDFDLFKQNRYDRELGGVYLHWSQIGKTLIEVFRDEHGVALTGDDDTHNTVPIDKFSLDSNKTLINGVVCSAINHQKFYSGEFDIDWGQSITEKNGFKKDEMDRFRTWLKTTEYSWDDPKLSLGYIKLGQIDLKRSFGTDNFLKIYKILLNNLNISKIEIIDSDNISNEYPYTLDSENWKQIQKDFLKEGYESHSLR